MLLHEFYLKIRRAIFWEKKLFEGGEAFPLDWKDRVAVLYIHPPKRQVTALCSIAIGEPYCINNLLKDPVSLCIAGGLRSKIQHFCKEHGKSHGTSNRYYAGLWGFFVFSLVSYIPLLTIDSGNIFFWIAVASVADGIAEKAHKTSTLYLDSKYQFWRSWMDSGLESNLLGVLSECGYYFEIEVVDYGWKLSLYKVQGEASSLPPPRREDDESAEESAQKIWDIFQRAGILGRRRHSSTCNYLDTNRNDDEDDDMPPNPLDVWTIRGLFLGRMLNSRKQQKATQLFGVIIMSSFVLFIATVPIPFLWLLVMYFTGTIVCIAAITIFHDLVDMPSCRLAQDELCRRLSPVIQDRHGGHTLVYEIKPIATGFFRICCWSKRGVFVLETPATTTTA